MHGQQVARNPTEAGGDCVQFHLLERTILERVHHVVGPQQAQRYIGLEMRHFHQFIFTIRRNSARTAGDRRLSLLSFQSQYPSGDVQGSTVRADSSKGER